MTTPTLLLSGGESAQYFKDATDAVYDALPDSQIAILDGHGHVAMTTAPDLCIDEVLAFIRESIEETNGCSPYHSRRPFDMPM